MRDEILRFAQNDVDAGPECVSRVMRTTSPFAGGVGVFFTLETRHPHWARTHLRTTKSLTISIAAISCKMAHKFNRNRYTTGNVVSRS